MKTQTKIILRRLPSCLTKDQFLDLIDPSYIFNYFRFCSSKNSQDLLYNTRVYIDFFTEDDMYKFKNEFDHKLFNDGEGNQCYCIIEFAAFQKVPCKNSRDSKQNTLALDIDYLKFIKDIDSITNNADIGTVESNLEEIRNKISNKELVKTALIQYIETLPKKERFWRKNDYIKSTKKDTENFGMNKTQRNIKKNNTKDSYRVYSSKPEHNNIGQKIEDNKSNTQRKVQQKPSAQTYDQFPKNNNIYSEQRGFEYKYPKSGRQETFGIAGEQKNDYGSKYSNSRNFNNDRKTNEHNNNNNIYNQKSDYNGYVENCSASTYSRPTSTVKQGGGPRRPPSYSTTRKG